MSYDTIYLKLDQTFINALTPQSLRVGVTSTFTAGKLYQLNVGGEIFMAKLQIIGQKQYIFDKITDFNYISRELEFVIDCDSKMFRHILNYCRYGKLLLPYDFNEHELLIEEAKSFKMEGNYFETL